MCSCTVRTIWMEDAVRTVAIVWSIWMVRFVGLHRCYSTISTAANLPLNKMGEALKLRGVLSGHGGWITAIATTQEDSTMVLTASRDKVCRFNSILFLMYLTWLT